jgi:hypothetical protein
MKTKVGVSSRGDWIDKQEFEDEAEKIVCNDV